MQITDTISSTERVRTTGLYAALGMFLGLLIGAVSPSAAQVTPGIIEFNGVTQGETNITINGIYFGDLSAGGTFDGWKGEDRFGNPSPEVDAESINPNPATTQARFVSSDGSNFQIDALDFDNFSGQSIDVVITGYRDGSTVSGASKTTTLSNGAGGSWVTVPLGADFERIDEVRVSTNGYTAQNPSGLAMDNLVVDNAATSNTAPTVATNTGSTVNEGANAPITQSELETTDNEQSASSLTYTIDTDVAEGQLVNTNTSTQLDQSDTFTQAAINSGNIEYQHDGSEPTGESFAFTVRDGAGGSASGTFSITINAVNDAPTITTNSGLSLDEGATATISTGDLSASDPDDSAGNLTYTVTGGPANGTLLVGGTAATSFTQQNLADGTVAYRHDGSETTSGDFTFTLTDDDGAGPTGRTFAITVSPQNDAPTISTITDQTIAEDATLSSLSFTVDDAETSDLSTLSLSGSSSNTTLVPTSNISFTGPDASGNASITVEPAANESGTATITVTVDDGAASNNTASDDFTLTVEPVVDVTLTDGSPSGLDFTADVEPGTNDNPVGAFRLAAEQNGAAFDGVTITNRAPGVSGITDAHLYLSIDPTLEPGEDLQAASFDVDDTSAEATIPFTGIGESIPTGGYYAIVAIDVADGATASGVQFELAQVSDLSLSGGSDGMVAGAEVATINGQSSAPYPLSNSTTTLPVELAGFDAQASGSEAVRLRWETASETGNAGFDIQRRVKPSRGDGSTGPENWQTVGSVDGAGTTTEARSYAFTDTGVPYDADSLTYRLKQIDVDGSVSYSAARTVARSDVKQVRLLGTYPNPARSRATVEFAVPEGTSDGVTLRLYDLLGRQVQTVRSAAGAGRHELSLDTSDLPSGTYFLRLRVGSTTKTQQVTVVQ